MSVVNANGELPVRDTTTSPNELLVMKPAIGNTYHNRTVVNETRDSGIIDALKGFMAGTPIITTWYHQLSAEGGTRSLPNVPSLLSDSVNVSFLKIVNMEVKLPSGVAYNFDPESIDSELVGNCLTYPGFTPKLGDLFTYQMSPGKLGVMKVSDNPQRLSTHNNTAYNVPFTLFAILTQEIQTALTERTRQTLYFNKQRFLGGSNAFIEEQEVLDLKYLATNLTKLERLYHVRYYSAEFNTFMVPSNGPFDPYIVKFYQETFGSYTLGKYINMSSTFELLKHWEVSIYASILGINPLSTPLMTCTIKQVNQPKWSSLITYLHARDLVTLDPVGETPYISDTVLSLLDNQTTFDKLVTLKIEYNKLSIPMLREAIDAVEQLTTLEGFYQIPVLMYFVKLANLALLGGDTLNMVNVKIDPYLHIPFTATNVLEGVVSLEVRTPDIIALIDNTGNLINIGDGLITYPDATHASIDINIIFDTLDITTLPGTWYAVAKNIFA